LIDFFSGSLVVGEKAKKPLSEDFYLNIHHVEEHFTLADILYELPRLCHVRLDSSSIRSKQFAFFQSMGGMLKAVV
jgi:hypothetical protein